MLEIDKKKQKRKTLGSRAVISYGSVRERSNFENRRTRSRWRFARVILPSDGLDNVVFFIVCGGII